MVAAAGISTGGAAPEALDHLLRRCRHAERPFGAESFVAEFEEKLGRSWKRYPHGCSGRSAVDIRAWCATLERLTLTSFR